jgi:hypothetical protein
VLELLGNYWGMTKKRRQNFLISGTTIQYVAQQVICAKQANHEMPNRLILPAF